MRNNRWTLLRSDSGASSSPRFTAAEVEKHAAPLRARIAGLEALRAEV
jgi:hypothetical protein